MSKAPHRKLWKADRWFWFGSALAVSALGSSGCGSADSERVAHRGNAILNGTDVASPQDVGFVHLTINGVGAGSGLLLNDRWALTAAHTFERTRCPLELPSAPIRGNSRRTCRFVPGGVYVARGNLNTEVSRVGVRLSVHPMYSPRLVDSDNVDESIVDAALIQTEPFTGVSFPTRRLMQNDSVANGTSLYCFGYSRNTLEAPSTPDVNRGFGTLRFGGLTIEGSNASHILHVTNGNDQATIPGDSGGPCTLVNPAGGVAASLDGEEILGVVRTGQTKRNPDGTLHGSITRASAFAQWAEYVMTSIEDMNYDWDGDLQPDALFWFQEGTNLVLRWQKNGQGTAADTGVSIPVSQLGDLSTFHSAIGNFDGDGSDTDHLDLVASTSTASIYRNGPLATGGTTGVNVPLRPAANQIVYTEDVDGIAPDDVVVIDESGRQWIHFGTRGLNPPRLAALEARAYTLTDVDADGTLDRVVFGRDRNNPGNGLMVIRVYFDDGEINNGDTHSTSIINLNRDPMMVPGDFNGDGYGDAALYVETTENNGTYENIWYYASNTNRFPEFQRVVMREESTVANIYSTLVKYLEVTDFTPQTAAQDLLLTRFDDSGTLFRGRQGTWNSSSAGLASSERSVVGGLPTVSARDGKFLTLTGRGRSTYNAPYTEFRLSSDSPNATIQIYDANTVGAADSLDESTDTCFQVYDDPCADGQNSCGLGDPVLLTGSAVAGSTTDDDAWHTIADGSQTARPGLNGQYHYRVVGYLSRTGNCGLTRAQAIEESRASEVGGWNGFKVRGTGFLSYQFGELQVIGSSLSRGTGNWATGPESWLRASDYDAQFTLYFDVSDAVLPAATDPLDADIRLAEADADYLGDQDAPGNAVGANDTISFLLLDPNKAAVTLDRTDDSGAVTESVGDSTVRDPSGNFDGAGTQADLERYKVPEANELPGRWTWLWQSVYVHNNIHLFAPQASPVVHEVFGAPMDPPILTAALPLEAWRTSGVGSPALPLVLGSVTSSGSPEGESVVLATASAVQNVIDASGGDPMQRLVQTLTVSKLNLGRAAAQGERLAEALVRGARVSVRTLVNQADAALRGPRALVAAEDVDRLNILLGAVNKGQVTYFRPGVELPAGPGLDVDGDGFLGIEDNCPSLPNPTQADSDANGVGDACSVQPLLDCVLPIGSNRYRAYLSYDNPVEFRSIALGVHNRFTPGAEDRGQPREFIGGQAVAALTVEFGANETLTWNLDGRSVQIDASAMRCQGRELLDVPDFERVPLFASDSLTLRDYAVVEGDPGTTRLLSGGSLEIGAHAAVPEAWTRNDAWVRSAGTVNGALVSGGTITLQAEAQIVGPALQQAFVPTHSIALTVTFPSSNQGTVIVEPGTSRTLAPGAYADVFARGVVRLSTGVYYFESLMLESNGELLLDQQAGPVTVYIRSSLTDRGRIDAMDGAFPDLFVGYLGTQDAFIETGFRGAIVAPNGKLVLGNQLGVHEGQFFAKAIELRANAVVRSPE